MKKQSVYNQPIIFFRIAWMENYNGVTSNDIPKGAGSYVTENKNGGEVYNFTNRNGMYYGFVRIQGDKTINLTKLGASKYDTEINGVTVVFFAKNPIDGGQWIVGWYKNATIFKDLQFLKKKDKNNWYTYLASCTIKNGKLLNINERNWEVEGAGQMNIWYPNKYLTKVQMDSLKEYIETGKMPERKNKPRISGGGGWMKDVELRKQIEVAAMERVVDYFSNKGFNCEYVHKENKGWDIEISKGNKLYQVEVKGTQHDFSTVELTPNEYKMMMAKKKTYRVCIVSHAINAQKQTLDTFHYNGEFWVNDLGLKLNLSVIKSAKLSLL